MYDPDKKKYIGFLSLMDLVAWVVMVQHEHSINNGTEDVATILQRWPELSCLCGHK